MKRIVARLAILLLSSWAVGAAGETAPRVWADAGQLYYGDDLKKTSIGRGGGDRDPMLSPDGTMVAYVHEEAPEGKGFQSERSTLWTLDLAHGYLVMPVRPHGGKDPQDHFNSVYSPVWSIDGHTIYVLAEAWVTSEAVHAIDLVKHTEKFICSGNSLAVIRNGPYRGDLLVNQHKYYTGGQGGSYDPTYVIKPNGKVVMMVPGSDKDEDEAVDRWLKRNHWIAN